LLLASHFCIMGPKRSHAMNFDEKYQLLDLSQDESAKTFAAREISTGRKVTVFLFVGEQARLQSDLLESLRKADRSRLPELIEVGDNRGTPYVVTQPLSGLSELKQRLAGISGSATTPSKTARRVDEFTKAGMWRVPPVLPGDPGSLKKPAGEPASVVRPKPPASITGEKPAGEFTRMFQSPAPSIGEATQPVAAPVASEQQIQAAPSPVAIPGEFTKMFQSPAPPIGEATQPVVLPAPREEQKQTPPPAAAQPGEFTGLFRAPAPPMGEVTPPVVPPVPDEQKQASPTAEPAPGEFTKFFQSTPPAPVEPAVIPAKPGSPGQFTQIFGSGGGVPAPTNIRSTEPASSRIFDSSSRSVVEGPPAYTNPPGQFTRIFGGGPAGEQTSAPLQTAPMTPAVPSAAAPGEYTRIFGAQSIPPPSEPVPAPAPAAPAPVESAPPAVGAKHGSKLPLILAGVIILLLIAAVVVLLVTRK
jgi:hypothetical protein